MYKITDVLKTMENNVELPCYSWRIKMKKYKTLQEFWDNTTSYMGCSEILRFIISQECISGLKDDTICYIKDVLTIAKDIFYHDGIPTFETVALIKFMIPSLDEIFDEYSLTH